MIIEVCTKLECEICDKFLTLLIQDERKYDETIEKNFLVQNYFVNLIGKGHFLFLYKKGDLPIGYIFAKRVENGYLIDGLYVDPLFRKKGIATQLLDNTINKIMDLGNFNIYINVLKENKQALDLYKNNGFIIEKTEDIKYTMIYSKK